jgi:dihydrodipicolinate synthase/N-acetylneuraminate lyase
MGAVGGILAVSDIFPAMCVELFQAAQSGDMMRARDLQYRLLEPTRTIVARLGIPAIKYAMDKQGFYGGPARAPFLPLTDSQKKEVEMVIAAAVLEVEHQAR